MTMNDDGDDGAGPHCSGALFFGGFDDAGADEDYGEVGHPA